MSWSIKSVGTCAAVRAEVETHATIPKGIKQTIIEILAQPWGQSGGPQKLDGARLEGWGYCAEEIYGGIGKLELELLSLAKEPVAASAGPLAPFTGGNISADLGPSRGIRL